MRNQLTTRCSCSFWERNRGDYCLSLRERARGDYSLSLWERARVRAYGSATLLMTICRRLSRRQKEVKDAFALLNPHPRPFSQREKGEIPKTEKGEIPNREKGEIRSAK